MNGSGLPVMANARTWPRSFHGRELQSGKPALTLRYGRVDPNSDNIFQRFRDGRISRTEAIAEVHQWRRNQNVG